MDLKEINMNLIVLKLGAVGIVEHPGSHTSFSIVHFKLTLI
jgi:hypothetical protein